MQPRSFFVKAATLSFFVIMCGVFVAYEAGAFHTKPGKLRWVCDRYNHSFVSKGSKLRTKTTQFWRPPVPIVPKYDHMSSSKVAITTAEYDYFYLIPGTSRMIYASTPFGLLVEPGFVGDENGIINIKK